MLNVNRRLLAAGFFSLVIVVVLVVIVVTEITNASISTPVLRLLHPVTRGATFNNQDVQVVEVHQDPASFSHIQPGDPNLTKEVYALSLQDGDILRPDDLMLQGDNVDIQVTVSPTAPIAANDMVDIFAIFNGAPVLIGHDIQVKSTGGSTMVINVPVSQEYLWLIIAISNTQLHVLHSTNVVLMPGSSDVNSAIQQLCGAPCGGSGAPGTSSTPPGGSTTSPTAAPVASPTP